MKDTWELTGLLGWAFAALVIAAGLLLLQCTVVRIAMTSKMLESENPAE